MDRAPDEFLLESLISDLRERNVKEWSQTALLACLETIGTAGPTETDSVRVLNAWTGPGDSFSVVYVPPWSERTVGIRRNRASEDVSYFPEYEQGIEFDAADYGRAVAMWDIDEPFGVEDPSLWRDSAGIRWWGDI
jgi:hypothetical protein